MAKTGLSQVVRDHFDSMSRVELNDALHEAEQETRRCETLLAFGGAAAEAKRDRQRQVVAYIQECLLRDVPAKKRRGR